MGAQPLLLSGGLPRKDAALISRADDGELRRGGCIGSWTTMAPPGEEGGIERWLALTEGLGLDRA